jgi:tetratricopeptide (TPR) repeat protein
MNNLGLAYRWAGHLPQAVALLEETRDAMKAKGGADWIETLNTTNNLAEALVASERPARAISMLEESLPLCKSKLGPDHPITATCRYNLTAAYAATGRPAKAKPLKGKPKTAQYQADHAPSPVNPHLLRVRRLAEQKRSREAEAALAKIAELPSNDAQGYRERGRIYFALGLADKATADFRKAVELLDERALELLVPPSRPAASEADKLIARLDDALLPKLTAAIERNPDDMTRRWSRGRMVRAPCALERSRRRFHRGARSQDCPFK